MRWLLPSRRWFWPAAILGALTGCAAPVRPMPGGRTPGAHVPDFARVPYQPFSRAAAVAIALREWRLFGQPVHDEPPDTREPLAEDDIPARQEGLWQRVGEYWWMGQDPGRREAAWTGKHDASGRAFSPEQEDTYAWSAAFISYVMRIAGATDRFPYAIAHATYINAAAQPGNSGWAIKAERPEDYAPLPGDLICTGRERAETLRFDDLPAPRFPAHCDIVVATTAGELAVIGGNVGAAVSMKHVPVTPEGRLAERDGTVLDDRYPWLAVLRVLYDR